MTKAEQHSGAPDAAILAGRNSEAKRTFGGKWPFLAAGLAIALSAGTAYAGETAKAAAVSGSVDPFGAMAAIALTGSLVYLLCRGLKGGLEGDKKEEQSQSEYMRELMERNEHDY